MACTRHALLLLPQFFMETIMKRLSLFTLCLLLAGVMAASSTYAAPQKQIVISGESRHSSPAPKQNFIGNVRVDPAFETQAPQRVYGSYVTFEPGARTNWHTHPLGQTLLVTFGVGLTQEWGGPVQVIRQGDVVLCPPNVKHWHGAAKDSWFAHVAIEVPAEGASNEWCEPVSDGDYDKLK